MADTSISLKQCSRKDDCVNPLGSWLPATTEYFHRNKATDDELHRCCKCCRQIESLQRYVTHKTEIKASAKKYTEEHSEERKVYQAIYYQANRSRVDAVTRSWVELHPERRKQITLASYHKNKDKPRNKCYRQAYERQRPKRLQKQSKRANNWRKENPEKARARDRRMYLKHRERYIAKAHRRRISELTAQGAHTASDLKLLYQSQKGLCWWCSKPVAQKYHVDHRIPLSRGGTNAPENLCIACPSCNLSKGAKLPQEWNGRLL